MVTSLLGRNVTYPPDSSERRASRRATFPTCSEVASVSSESLSPGANLPSMIASLSFSLRSLVKDLNRFSARVAPFIITYCPQDSLPQKERRIFPLKEFFEDPTPSLTVSLS